MDITKETKVTINVNMDDIVEMAIDKFKKENPNTKFKLISTFSKERVVGQNWISNTESEDEYGFSHIEIILEEFK